MARSNNPSCDNETSRSGYHSGEGDRLCGYLKHGTPALTPESAEMLRTNLETLIGYGSDNYRS